MSEIILNNVSNASDPIGIFDSGIGGMTVARAVKSLLPNEQIVYFGDTAHLPYGDKSTAAIQAYSIKICDVLLNARCKVVLIACNSASAAANDLIKEYVGSKAKVFNVIDPVVHYIREHYHNTSIGLIGTKQTIGSKVFNTKIEQLNSNVTLKALATPLLVPMIEEGYLNGNISNDIVSNYLGNPGLSGITSLILGCTHYPLIKTNIETYYKGKVDVLDSSEIVAKSLKAYLEYNLLANPNNTVTNKFMVSDYTEDFENLTRLFFGKKVHLEKYKLWE